MDFLSENPSEFRKAVTVNSTVFTVPRSRFDAATENVDKGFLRSLEACFRISLELGIFHLYTKAQSEIETETEANSITF